MILRTKGPTVCWLTSLAEANGRAVSPINILLDLTQPFRLGYVNDRGFAPNSQGCISGFDRSGLTWALFIFEERREPSGEGTSFNCQLL